MVVSQNDDLLKHVEAGAVQRILQAILDFWNLAMGRGYIDEARGGEAVPGEV